MTCGAAGSWFIGNAVVLRTLVAAAAAAAVTGAVLMRSWDRSAGRRGRKVMQYLGSPEYANARQKAQAARVGGGQSGFLTGNSKADVSLWSAMEQEFLETLKTADPAAFDGSDNMPAEVGSGAFWTEATSFVNGDTDAQTATDNINDAWPS